MGEYNRFLPQGACLPSIGNPGDHTVRAHSHVLEIWNKIQNPEINGRGNEEMLVKGNSCKRKTSGDLKYSMETIVNCIVLYT